MNSVFVETWDAFKMLADNIIRARFAKEPFQLQRGLLFPFLRAKHLCTSLLIMRTPSFYYPVRRGYISNISVHLVQKYFPHDYSTDSTSCSELGKKESYEKNIKTRQRLDRDEKVLLLET